MILKVMMSASTAGKDYREVLKKRNYLFYAFIFLGILTMILSLVFSGGSHNYLSPFLSGLYMGIGTGLTLVGVLFLFKTRKILGDEKKLREKKLAEQDERNITIAQKTMSATGLLLLFVIYLGLIFSGIFSMTVFWTLWILVMVYFVIFVACYFYYKHKL